MTTETPNDLSMTSDEFRAAVEFLFGGYGSQRGFAREVRMHETSIRRYIQGREVPAPMVLLLAYMFERYKAGFMPTLSDPAATVGELIRTAEAHKVIAAA